MKKSGIVAIIGRPNVGKSTLMNALIGMKIAITSPRPQTTRNRIRTVFTDERGQIVFLDTPGIHKAKNKLGEYMDKVALHTLNDADAVLWLVEPSQFIGAGEQSIIEQLRKSDTPVILGINKVDSVPEEEVFAAIDTYRKAFDFAEVVPLSALKRKNLEELKKTLFHYMPEGEPFYDEDTVTDQPERQIAAELIREQALRQLSDEIPHGVAVVIDTFDEGTGRDGKGLVTIEATIICERDSHKGIIIGKGGSRLKQIGIKSREQIERLLDCHVNLKLFVKVKKDWRESDFLIRNYVLGSEIGELNE